jgi:hypothetical protein
MGADDYLKPLNPPELVARIHTAGDTPNALGGRAADGRITFGPYVLDLSTRTLLRGDSPIALTTGEFGLLKVLVTHPRQPLAREKLMLLARGRDHDVFDRAIDVQVSRLRKLVEPDPSSPRYIQIWARYVFVPDEAKDESAPARPVPIIRLQAAVAVRPACAAAGRHPGQPGRAIYLFRQDRRVTSAFSDTKLCNCALHRRWLPPTRALPMQRSLDWARRTVRASFPMASGGRSESRHRIRCWSSSRTG